MYTNAWSKLEVGRCRYGLMLKEDGMVMDDGVTARLGPDHFLMHTTTGNAAPVLNHLEEYLQTEWPELKVFCTSVTEQWSTVQVAGPFARRLLEELLPDWDLSTEAFPFMSVKEGKALGVTARVFRISFTGEQSFEVNVPASYGRGLWSALMAAGKKYGVTPYGTEAMHVLRAEKGFIIVGQETDGSINPLDLGMDGLVSKTKDFVGKRSLYRADMAKPDRKQLVGIFTDDPEGRAARGRAPGRGAAAEAADADAGAHHVELLEPEPEPLDRHGAGEGRTCAPGPEAALAAAGWPGGPGDGLRDRVPRQGRRAAAWLTSPSSGSRRSTTARCPRARE